MANWPARAYIYGTWGYALWNARILATERKMKVYVYQGFLDNDRIWAVSWDPKERRDA